MEEQAAEVRIQRGQIKASLTRVDKFLEKHEATPQLSQVKARYDKLLSIMEDFNINQDKLERLDESELDTNEREEFEDKYFHFIARFQNTITVPEAQSPERNYACTEIVNCPELNCPNLLYDTAWKMLSESYSNHRIIVQRKCNCATPNIRRSSKAYKSSNRSEASNPVLGRSSIITYY
ncbi:hypothetical protein QE152_g317 [Popillia japonica]|uniref:Uncharacterized protein n=1 Tax=Popillia japonica TaxID=7064 RepID=A0AAW1NK50_POPJA